MFILNSFIVILLTINILLGYLFVSKFSTHTSQLHTEKYIDSLKTIQVEVLNGCGKAGIGEQVVDFLRKKKIDVVQTGNYISFDVPQSLIIDRTGNYEKAKIIASILSIDSTNILRIYNKNYLLDVSVILGKDNKSLSLIK